MVKLESTALPQTVIEAGGLAVCHLDTSGTCQKV